MNTDVYRLVYCSHNRIRGTEEEISAEIQQILSTSRTNNEKAGLTGALFYNDGSFAQTLEGPLEAIEETFERIQQDMRHGEVTIVENGPVASRIFGDWAMAMCDNAAVVSATQTQAAFDAAFARSNGAGGTLLDLLKNLVVQENEGVLIDTW